MGDGKKGVEGGSTSQGDAAASWVAENGSDRAVDEVTVSLWEEWFAQPGNAVEYVAMVDVPGWLRGLSAPAFDGSEALVRDALAEVSEAR